MATIPGKIISTHGTLLPLLSLGPEHFEIRDIAHSLSGQNRYLSRGRFFYSVAEHSVQVSRYIEAYAKGVMPDYPSAVRDLARRALIHDAEEAFLPDLVAPYKALPEFRPYVERGLLIRRRIFEWLDLSPLMPIPEGTIVQNVDHWIIGNEARALFPNRPPEWKIPEPLAAVEIRGLAPEEAEREFLARFAELWPERAGEVTP